MDDRSFISGKHGNPNVYNNPKDSDIILKCGDHQCATFNIDHDKPGDLEEFDAVLKHIYGMPFGEHKNNDGDCDWCGNIFEHITRVYKMADKYDVPSVRRAAIRLSIEYLEDNALYDHDYTGARGSCAYPIADICGPDAPELADPALRNALFDWFAKHFDPLSQDKVFNSKIADGSLLDSELTAKLLVKLSTQIGSLKKKRQSESSFVG
ncbi:hypothetical protein E4T49_00912 [Aureobasidium sp. EXF-10728]|nr:hypothetical protein E4T49_00912 [Aureobasidium sp. EXF-10728]